MEIVVGEVDLEGDEAVIVVDEEVFREVVAEVSFYNFLELSFCIDSIIERNTLWYTLSLVLRKNCGNKSS